MMPTVASRHSEVAGAGLVFWCCLVAAGLVVMASVGLAPALAQEDQEDGADGDADSLVTAVSGTGAVGGRKSEKGPDLWEAHPSYTMNINKRKDVTNWDSKIGLSTQLSDKISLNLNGTVVSRENTTLNRLDATDGTSAALRYKFSEAIGFSINYAANVSSFSYDLKGDGPRDKKKNEDLTISSELTKKMFGVADVNVRVTAGSTANSFAAISNSGRKQALTASVAFAPSPRIRASATYTGNRLFVDSRVRSVDSQGDSASGNTTQDRTFQDKTFSNKIALSLSYELLPGITFGADASEGTDRRQHPEQKAGEKEGETEWEQETERKVTRSASLTSSFEFMKRLTWEMGIGFNSNDNKYEVRKTINSRSKSADLRGSAKITAWRGATLNVGGTREISRDIYEPDSSSVTGGETGENLHKSLSLKLAQEMGPKASLNLTAISDLTSVAYDDKDTNPKDRDRLSNRVSADVSYKPRNNIKTRFGAEYSEEQSVYVKAASSANNRTQTRYRVTGSYDVKTYHKIDLTQTYEIGAVYSVYQFDESDNFLVRNSNISTRLRVPVSLGIQVDVDHTYRYQDQGGYRESGKNKYYGRSGGSESNTFAVGTGYNIRRIQFSLRQAYSVQDTWDYKDDKKVFKSGNWSVEITGRIGFKYEFKERTKFSFAVEENRKEGSNVGEALKHYWNIELEGSHVF